MRALIVALNLDEVSALRGLLDSEGVDGVEALLPEGLLGESGLETLGLERIYAVEGLEESSAQAIAKALKGLVESERYSLLAAPSRKLLREVFARASQSLGAPCLIDCLDIRLSDERVIVERPTLGGGYIESLAVKRIPVFLTFQLLGRRPRERSASVCEVVKLGRLRDDWGSMRRVDLRPAGEGAGDLARARVVVAVGRGLKRREDLRLAEELAELLGGELACSRPIASDLAWMPEERYVGLSGKWINPQLYITLGISGQVQHMVGVKNSRIIVAVNNDPAAPIHREADFSIVMDLYQFVPALIKALKEMRVRGE